MKIQVVEGFFGGFHSGAVTRSGSRQLTKYDFHYIEHMVIDGVRWNNIFTTSSMVDDMADMKGKKTKFFYIEDTFNDVKERIIVGFESENTQIKSLMMNEMKISIRNISKIYNICAILVCALWFCVGSVATRLMTYNTDSGTVGWVIVASGLGVCLWCVMKKKNKSLAPLKAALEFSQNHDKSV